MSNETTLHSVLHVLPWLSDTQLLKEESRSSSNGLLLSFLLFVMAEPMQ